MKPLLTILLLIVANAVFSQVDTIKITVGFDSAALYQRRAVDTQYLNTAKDTLFYTINQEPRFIALAGIFTDTYLVAATYSCTTEVLTMTLNTGGTVTTTIPCGGAGTFTNTDERDSIALSKPISLNAGNNISIDGATTQTLGGTPSWTIHANVASSTWNGLVYQTFFGSSGGVGFGGNQVVHVYTGTATATWTLPASGSHNNRQMLFKNGGTATLTLAADAADDFYTSESKTSIDLAPGESVWMASAFTSNRWYALFLNGNTTSSSGGGGCGDPRVSPIVSSSTPGVNSDDYDMLVITALAANATIQNPTGTPVNGRKLIIRIKDNGTARTLAYGSSFRASSDMAAPTTTIASKQLYLGFIYNAEDSKWDLVTVLNNY